MLEKLDTLGACLLAVLIAGTFLFFIIAHAIGFKYCKKLFGTRRITQQTQEIPLEGDLFAACYIRTNQPRVLDQHIHHELPAAFLYRWYKEGKLKLVQQKPALEIVNYLSIQKDAVIRDKEENSLYQKFCDAAGEDGLLDVDEVYDWSYRHPGDLYGFKPEVKGKEWFEDRRMIEPGNPKDKMTNLGVRIRPLTPAGAAEARRLVELQNFLQAQAEDKPCDPVDTNRIDDLLCYGQFFGIADKLVEKWSKYLSEETKIVVKLCRDLAQAFFDGNNNSTD
ncbi:MAG: hypothetical protein IJJ72_09800 [Bacteroidales bacterium]|nr:hypothetical protein [Bacteroidales bacterium]